MPRRLVPVAAFAAVLALSTTAGAAPRHCRLVTDPKGDGVGTTSSVPPAADDLADDGDLDVVSADVANDAKNVTAVIRLASLRGEASPDSPLGRAWDLWFTVAEQTYIMQAATGPDGYSGIVYRLTFDQSQGGTGTGPYVGEGIGSARVTLDTARREVRITAPLSRFAPYEPIVKGRQLRQLSARTYKHHGTGGGGMEIVDDFGVWYGSGGVGKGVDVAYSAKAYPVGAPSCVAVGR